ncbi:hypothetical protein GUITHDRAFT_106161 [Guillardia theta CCMP2712]|uniref:Uncharacterized protein n=1 Tax=Guillardia theta (strain CCMP2712) TaxID=905079 RepID=L1JHV9_GUITC|nr:hypothetical protein GUITHDRAFT_106161 [Guillardia theta CCMP2712]EKX48081.1 hypothetical protein GUITHDRAFT_106161 [Guillardia theta CCMP2712]|eukprot:XP_005835061.1 hypothetical protein GUITHDRAFT_106161 [Guillardia theta CCMP2712]
MPRHDGSKKRTKSIAKMAYTNNEEDNTPVISAIESARAHRLEKGVYQLILALAIGFLAGYAVAKAH